MSVYIDNKEIVKLYNEIKISWEKNLKKFGVALPNLYSSGSYTKNALVLVYLYKNIKKVVTKEELTDFLRNNSSISQDVQQARHLAQQNGWYIISGKRGDLECKTYNVQNGEYMLLTIEKPYPSYSNLKRSENLKTETFEELKKIYNYRCATCGSKEGERNYLYPETITVLQKGHINPSKPLTSENTIPQCQFCNQPNRDYFVYNTKGRVISIYDPQFIFKSERRNTNKNVKTFNRKISR